MSDADLCSKKVGHQVDFIHVGALVTQEDGGPIMTVNRRIYSEHSSECVWFLRTQLQVKVFSDNALVEPLRNGSLAVRRNGGPIMTVNRQIASENKRECVWFNGDELCIEIIPVLVLSSNCYGLDAENTSEYSRNFIDNGEDPFGNPIDDNGEDPFGNPIVDSWVDDDGETWYEDEYENCYIEEMGPPDNWPD